MPSKNMLPKGHRHRSVRAEYRATRGAEPTPDAAIPVLDLDALDPLDQDPGTDLEAVSGPAMRRFLADPAAAGLRLDQYLAQALPDISRARVQLLIDSGQVRVSGLRAKAKLKLHGGEALEIEGEPRPAPLHAFPEAIALDIVFEDKHLAVINKPAGMVVHAGAGNAAASPEQQDPRNSGTLVNALLHHFAQLSGIGGDLRPGIVHRLDKQTSGLIVVAKEDSTHRRLGEMFAARQVGKTYLALVHGHVKQDRVTVNLPIGRDLVRRIRMTTRRALSPGSPDVRAAVSHVSVLERLSTPFGPFTLVEVRIETGRTHQIRVHLQALGHPVVGDTLYGAPHVLGLLAKPGRPSPPNAPTLSLSRNFLHAAHLTFTHPQTSKPMDLHAPLPKDLEEFLAVLRSGQTTGDAPVE